MSGRNVVAAVMVVSLIVLAGCSGGMSAGGGGADHEGGPNTAAGESGGDEGSGGTEGDASQRLDGRAIIRSGEVELRVEFYDEARLNLTDTVEMMGGFVSDSTERTRDVGNDSYTIGTLVFRVPVEDFAAMFERTKEEGTVVRASTSTEDVTGKVVDLKARLGNLRAERDRLRGLYEQANETKDVLAVERRLSEVQGEIERLEARQRALENRVAYATITVHLNEPRPDAVYTDLPNQSWYDTPIVDAFLESIRGVAVVLQALIVTTAYVAPYAVVFGLPTLAVVLLVRRRGSVIELYRQR